ncbi:hypothetical protein RHMOL_Rhmol07G0240200 [Rhododendron molle]|uniref:Uncharacterized protein n=1 Tax=Rhododendron molle TaxID=49168 RepID=A0ACC0N442_RHOML|nr:hypothetical protein RHMOL_Rhmol07G0240200 [Rhododendron molle]
MGRPITLEEGMSLLEEGIVRARMILDGYPSSALFTAEEYMKFYDTNRVTNLCIFLKDLQGLERRAFLQGSLLRLSLTKYVVVLLKGLICATLVLPSLQSKNGASLLKELTSMWANYKSMAKCLGGFFLYLDRPYRTATSLCDVSFRCFRDLVCNTHYPKLQEAAIALAEWCLKMEIQRVSEYLKQFTVGKLMQVLQWQLMGQTASKLIEKQKGENQDLQAYQELLSRYSSMSLKDGTSASPMLQ